MGLFASLRNGRQNRQIVDALWDQVVSSARDPRRFLEGGLPDTVQGRFESLSLEMILVLRRCGQDERLKELSQDLVDRFMTDLDHSMREFGISYLAVPKRMRKFAARFYTRVRDLEPAIEAGDADALRAGLVASSFRDAEGGRPDGAPWLAHHMLLQKDRYQALSTDGILAGALLDPPPQET
ncbi:ubiquinol-cytochrome C chaperone family protein [Aureimonas sp. ME7]|uniref:ubiquinol-cytochrome C chaperone family protein n=1 Tax=Aureimonas sp. ME7 TaxID=2744252 RepID=UPI0015F434E4|nr:ubiquinol-cytochrome C chaperone family protein [Aureimonas sp. ME7]